MPIDHIILCNTEGEKRTDGKIDLNTDGGEHCKTCEGFTNMVFIDHEFYCTTLKKMTRAGRCSDYVMNSEKYARSDDVLKYNEEHEKWYWYSERTEYTVIREATKEEVSDLLKKARKQALKSDSSFFRI